MRPCAALALLCAAIPALAARNLIDELGRAVTLPDHPHRLVCLAPNVVDDVYSLGAGADVIAVSDYTQYPPQARSKPSIGLPLNPSMETIVSLHPDLVLGSGDSRSSETLTSLGRLGIPVFMVSPHGIEGIYKSILSLGRALGRENSATPSSPPCASASPPSASASRPPPVNLLMPIWYDPIMTIGKYAYITDLIAIAGGRSVTADIPQEWPQVSLEAVIARAPEALLLVRGSGMSLESIQNRPGWQALPALRNHRIYYVGPQIELPSPVAFDALEELARQLHP